MRVWQRIRERITDASSVRGWTVDVNDGVIATAGVLQGLAAAGAGTRLIVIVVTLASVAGALTVGGAKWAEEASDREAVLRIAAAEAARIAADPDDEIAELAGLWEAKGLPPLLARQVAEELMSHDALAAQLDAEYGVDEIPPASAPPLAGLASGIAYAVGAVVPLLIAVFAPLSIGTGLVAAAVLASLVVTSLVSARLGDLSPWRMLARTFAVGLGTMAISYLVGALLV